MPSQHSELTGLLVVDKPGRPFAAAHNDTAVVAPPSPAAPTSSGPERLLTSHDMVSRVRRLSGQKRIGHTGTLDPMASGVLVLCLGNATRLVEYYQGEDKQYLAEITLGAATDTYDLEGVVAAQAPVPELDVAKLDAALDQFRGAILQQAPAFAAIKQGGSPLYLKARRGEIVSAPTRPITFHRIDVVNYDPPNRVLLRVKCSAGAYIRSLAHDLGLALGTYGHLSGLRREAVGEFMLSEAHTLDAIEVAARAGRFSELMCRAGDRLPLPMIVLDDEPIMRLGYGQLQSIQLPGATVDMLWQVQDANGRLVGILRTIHADEEAPQLWICKAEKWLG